MSQFIEMFGDPLKNPKNFTQRKLGEVVTLLNGRAYKASELLASGKYLVLRVGNFFSNSDYYYSDLELEPDKYCDTGDLLYSWSATLGAQIWEGGKVIFHYHIWKVLFDEKFLNRDFFCYMLNVMTDSLKQETHGSTMVHLTKEGMEKKIIAIPPMQLQKRFVAIFHQADKSGFDGRKSQFIEMFKDELNYKSLCNICRPKQWPTIQTKDFTEDGYLVYGANGVIGHYSDYNHEFPTILMACRGASCGAINVSEPRSYITGNAMCLDDLSDEICFEFLVHFLSYYDYRTIITGGAQPQITFSSLQKVSVPIPSKEKQKLFVEIARQADKSGFELRKSIDAIDKVIKSLINEN